MMKAFTFWSSILSVISAAAATTVSLTDASIAEWGQGNRIYPGFEESYDPATQSSLYMRYSNMEYFFHVKPPTGRGLQSSMIYLNIDMDDTTGYFGSSLGPKGQDYYILLQYNWLSVLEKVELRHGCPLWHSCPEPFAVIHTLTPAEYQVVDNTLEFKLQKSLLDDLNSQPVGDLHVALQLTTSLDQAVDKVTEYAPKFYLNWYAFYHDLEDLPECQSFQQRGAVVFSQDVQNNFFQDKAYSQLYGSMQSQFFQAGLPHDRINVQELLTLTKSCAYVVVLFPYWAYVKPEEYLAVRKTLFILSHIYSVGIIGVGDFVTNSAHDKSNLRGDPYFIMKEVFGLEDGNPVYTEVTKNVIKVKDNSSYFFKGFETGQFLMDDGLAGSFANFYQKVEGSVFEVNVLATQTVDMKYGSQNQVRNAIVSTSLGPNIFGKVSGTNVHFSTIELLGNADMAWRAIRHVMLARPGSAGVNFGMMLTRFKSIFTCRNDMDQSSYMAEAKLVEPEVLNVLKEYYEKFNFVCSNYINIGSHPEEDQHTDWDWARKLYSQYLNIENEIGSHSYNHPHDINKLSEEVLEFEFHEAQWEIADQLGLKDIGTAQPGATEDLRVAYVLEQWLDPNYFSGGYSGVRAGYPNVFGFLNDVSRMVYMAPNFYFDFSLIGFYKWSVEKSVAFWADQFKNLTMYSNRAILHLPVHDYGLANYNYDTQTLGDGSYPKEMFTKTFQMAYASGTEFITGMTLNKRIRAFDDSCMHVEKLSEMVYKVQIMSDPDKKHGTFALELMQNNDEYEIDHVGGHYAYDSTQVFVPTTPGIYEITLKKKTADSTVKTHVTFLDMRAELLRAVGDGVNLEFCLHGRGKATVMLAANTDSSKVKISGADDISIVGNIATLTFNEVKVHTVKVKIKVLGK